MREPLTEEQMLAAVAAYKRERGNRSLAARSLGMPRSTFNDWLRAAEARAGIRLMGRVADGAVETPTAEVRKWAPKGRRKHYLLTSAQNNTEVHPAWNNLLAMRDWLEEAEGHCEILVGTFSYQKGAYGEKAVKRGTKRAVDSAELYYADEVLPYVCDRLIEIGKGLVWDGRFNALPTATHPLTGLERRQGRKSVIVPHAKLAMQPVPSMRDEATKFLWSTGAITQLNYLQKLAGIRAEEEHSFCWLHVEVDEDGAWWVRPVEVGPDDSCYFIPPAPMSGLRRVQAGAVDEDEYRAEGILWGDPHSAEMEGWVRELAWGEGGMLDTLTPRHQFGGDLFSMRSRGHHEIDNFHRTYEKFIHGQDSVHDEILVTRDLLLDMHRSWCQTVVVRGNHDLHLERWLNEADFRHDPLNARFFLQAQDALLAAIEVGRPDFRVLEWALRRENAPDDVLFLGEDDSFILCKDWAGGIEHGLHGHLGPNGSRGSTRSLTKLARKINKAHDHQASILLGVWSAGACSLDFPYMRGPTSHSISHVVTMPNGTRTMVTMWDGRWRA